MFTSVQQSSGNTRRDREGEKASGKKMIKNPGLLEISENKNVQERYEK